jgi:short-subunit dehydrogenase
MHTRIDFRGQTALVTGASSGLGEEFARQLARFGANLILVARSEEKLNLLADNLREQGKIQVTVIPTDLSSADAVERLIAHIESDRIKVDILVNNAGIGLFKNFLDTTADSQMDQIKVNVCALVRLTHAFAPGMVSRKRGGVINIASVAGFQPLPGAGVYAASKSFVLLFSEALSLELEESGVRVLAACPGPVATNFFAAMQVQPKTKQMDHPAKIVSQILTAYAEHKRDVFPGKVLNWLGTFGARLLPRNTMVRLGAGMVKGFTQE